MLWGKGKPVEQKEMGSDINTVKKKNGANSIMQSDCITENQDNTIFVQGGCST